MVRATCRRTGCPSWAIFRIAIAFNTVQRTTGLASRDMRLATWNVNSLRVREDTVLNWLEATKPDVLCLQETKMTDQEFPEDLFGDLGYDAVYFGQRSYNGVAIISRPEMEGVAKG